MCIRDRPHSFSAQTLRQGQQSGGTWSVLTSARTVHATVIHTKASSPTTLPWLDGFRRAGALGNVNPKPSATGLGRHRTGIVDADVPAKYRHLSLLYCINIGAAKSNPILHQRQRIAAEDSPQTSLQARKHELRAECHRILHQ